MPTPHSTTTPSDQLRAGRHQSVTAPQDLYSRLKAALLLHGGTNLHASPASLPALDRREHLYKPVHSGEALLRHGALHDPRERAQISGPSKLTNVNVALYYTLHLHAPLAELTLCSGFALSYNGTWLPHSWLTDQSSGTVTELGRRHDIYFGLPLRDPVPPGTPGSRAFLAQFLPLEARGQLGSDQLHALRAGFGRQQVQERPN